MIKSSIAIVLVHAMNNLQLLEWAQSVFAMSQHYCLSTDQETRFWRSYFSKNQYIFCDEAKLNWTHVQVSGFPRYLETLKKLGILKYRFPGRESREFNAK